VVKYRSGEDDAVEYHHRHGDGITRANMAQSRLVRARAGDSESPMRAWSVGMTVGTPSIAEGDVTHERLVDDGVNSLAV
jgi:hypothetical protein